MNIYSWLGGGASKNPVVIRKNSRDRTTFGASYHQAGDMLRRIFIYGLLVVASIPAQAAKRLSVARLERLLAADSAAHRSDEEIARQMEGVVLTDRMTDAEFAQLAARVGSGSEAAAALQLLADESQFLQAAPEQAAPEAVPDSAAQARMLDAAREYVSTTLRRLPNFLSTRVISRYDDTPHADRPGNWPTRLGLHRVTTVHEPTSVSFDRENQPASQGSAAWRPGTGLVSGGEFGATLGMVLGDIAKGEVSWSHWEQTPAGTLAVFRYSVPESASHFEVFSSFRPEPSTEATRSAPNVRGISGVTLQQNANSGDVQLVREKPAYEGSLWVNPADGVVYRITMETDTKMGLRILRRAAILVEYGPVEIAGKKYICPVRSLAQADEVTTTESRLGDEATEWLNETVFTDYHRFGSSVRILGEEVKGPAAGTAPGDGRTAAGTPGEAVAENKGVTAPAPAEDKAPAPSQAHAVATVPTASTAVEATTAAETNAKRSETPAGTAPTAVAAAAPPATDTVTSQTVQPTPASPQEGGLTLKVNVNSLLVPTVVLDKNGDAVADLQISDFVVTDDGKRRKISGFTLVKSAPTVAERNTEGGAEPAAERNVATTESAPQQNRYLVFLFDDRHIDVAELQLVKKAASKLFEQPLPQGEYADVLSLTGANSGITRDPAALQAAVANLAAHRASRSVKENCPNIDYYAADQIIHHHNVDDFELAVQNARQCSMLEVNAPSSTDPYTAIDNPTDPFARAAKRAAENALALGDEDARESLLTVQNVVRAMAKLPGQRILILVSPGFLALSDETRELESQVMDIAAASDVTVNTLDARGLEGADIDASQGGTSLGLVSGQLIQERNVSMQVNQAVMSELAAGTGGRFFHDNNDLQDGLKSLAAAPEDLYLLEISLNDVKADGSYHRLRVKVDRPGVEVLARKGYAAPSKKAIKK